MRNAEDKYFGPSFTSFAAPTSAVGRRFLSQQTFTKEGHSYKINSDIGVLRSAACNGVCNIAAQFIRLQIIASCMDNRKRRRCIDIACMVASLIG